MLLKYIKQAVSNNKTFLLSILGGALLLFSSISSANENDDYRLETQVEDRSTEEWHAYEVINTYIVIPIKWVDNVVTEFISIIIPIKRADAAPTNPRKKSTKEEVVEALRGSEENIRVKNIAAYADGYTTALNAKAKWEKSAAEQMQDPELQRMIQHAMGMVTAQQQDPEFQKFLQQQAQTRQRVQTEAQLLNLFNTNSEPIKEYYKTNPSQLKKIFEEIINSDLAQELKEKAQRLLETLNSNPENLNHQEMMELIGKSIKNGGATLIICQTICTGLGTLVAGTATGGAGLLPGFGISLAECSALCANLGSITAVVTTAGNMYLREGKAEGDSNYAREEKVVENLDEVAKKIADGHAFDKHIKDFPGFKTKEDIARHVKNVIQDKNSIFKKLQDGRSAYWHEESKTVVIRDPKHADGGTVFKSSKRYFDVSIT